MNAGNSGCEGIDAPASDAFPLDAIAHVETRDDGGIAFYLDGDLQFDSADEAIYHEGLALPPLSLTQSTGDGLRVLICGGGDGLALREVLRFPGVAAVDLVDYSADVLELGRTRFAGLNENAFDDCRVYVHTADAFGFLAACDPATYDTILCDFTVPRHSEETRVFTREWYALVARALAPNGVVGLNAISPQRCPEAFACLRATAQAAGLHTLPFRVCIPSFRAQGYGAWGFLLAAHRPLTADDLAQVAACPVPTRALDLGGLSNAAGFDEAAEAARVAGAPVHTIERDALLPLILNPGSRTSPRRSGADMPTSLEGLFRAIPILHPYHTREMIESLAEQVAGSIQRIDLRRLIDALLAQAAHLGDAVRAELLSLRGYLDRLGPSGSFTMGRSVELFGEWARRLMVALALLLALANVVAPDNAFGKGSEGLGHASVSRGYSSEGGSFGRSSEGSFGGGRRSGYAASAPREGGSFGGARGFRTTSSVPEEGITGTGFRIHYGHGESTDIFGNSYKARVFRYRSSYTTVGSRGLGGYYSPGGSSAPIATGAPEDQSARFVADDDMLVLDNGDVVVTLSDSAYLLVSSGNVLLMSNASPDPLLSLYADPRLFANIAARLKDQRIAAEREIGLRRDWLSWVSWTAAFSPAIRTDEHELASLQDLSHRLLLASNRLGTPAASTPPDLPADLAQNAVELFADGGLLADGRVALIDSRGAYWFTDGATLTTNTAASPASASPHPCLPLFASALGGILAKLETESTADLASLDSDLRQLAQDKQSLQNDLATYNSLAAQNGSSYSVDYGTDEIPASDAISRTQNDLTQNASDTASTQAQRDRMNAQILLLHATRGRFGK